MDEASNNNQEALATLPAASNPADLGGLVAAVEGKMAELMRWHREQSGRLDADRAALDEQSRQQRAAFDDQREQFRRQSEEINGQRDRLEQDRERLTEQAQGLERQRTKLLELAQKLEAEQDALSREWTAVHHARELNEKLAAELDRQRDKVGERVSTWLGQAVASLEQPLRLTDEKKDLPLDAFEELEAFEADVTDKPEKKNKKAA